MVRKLVVRLIAAAALLLAAEAVNRAASIEAALADAQQRLTTLRAGVTTTAYDEVEQSMALAARVPVVGPRLLDDVRTQRAMASYWTGDYGTLTAPRREADAEAQDPDVLFLTANAGFRGLVQRRPDRATIVKGLDDVLRQYGDVLKAAPGHVDAAFNYEYVARLRDAISRGGQTNTLTDMPENMHGEEGDPPEGTKPPEFNVIVPMRPEERQDQFDAGVGGVPTRKG
jgi:hypothetical protein